MTSMAGEMIARRRSGLVWVISIYYVALSGLAIVGQFIEPEYADLSIEQIYYERSASYFENLLDDFVVPFCYLFGGVSLFLLRRAALFLLASGLAVDVLHTAWEIYARSFLEVYPGGWVMVLGVFFAVDLLTCFYAWWLSKKGVLQ